MLKMRLPLFIVLLFIILLSVLLRFYRFPSIPPSLNWDEVSIGYNAYSVLRTGRDEYGIFMPRSFRSLDDYKMPVYVYLAALTIGIFGYNDFSVRLPSAVSGVALVIVVYFLTLELWDNKRDRKKIKIFGFEISESHFGALLSSLIIAILPWNIQFSRMASEANVGLLFLSIAVLYFIKIKARNPGAFFIFIFFIALSSYTYLSNRMTAPLMGIFLIWQSRKSLWVIRRKLVIIFIFAFVIGLFYVSDTLQKNNLIRLQGTNVFVNEKQRFGDTLYKQNEKEIAYDGVLKINIPRRIFHNQDLIISSGLVLKNYFSHLSPNFLFFDSSQKLNHTPGVGLLYLWMIFLIPAGFLYLYYRWNPKYRNLLLFWVFISVLPASFTWDVPHPIRVFGMTVPLAIMSSAGIIALIREFNEKMPKAGIYILLIITLCIANFSTWRYMHQYLIHMPHERSDRWIFGRKELFDYLEKNKNLYDNIVVSSKLEWPYIFHLYYSGYDPVKYLGSGGTESGGWSSENKYDNYQFRQLVYAEDRLLQNSLLIGKPDEFPDNTLPLYEVNYLDGTPAIKVVVSSR